MLSIEIAQGLFLEQPMWMILLAGVGMGLVGAVIAIVYQRLAFVLAGFYAGLFLTIILAGELGLAAMSAVTPFIIGVLGAVLALLMTDWAIILLSSLAGAALIVTTFLTYSQALQSRASWCWLSSACSCSGICLHTGGGLTRQVKRIACIELATFSRSPSPLTGWR